MKENKDNLASITYRLTTGNEIVIDVEIEEFDKESIENLAKVCANIASDQLAYETISHIRDLLINHNQMGLLMPFVSKLNENSTMITKLFTSKEQEENKQQPCIRPSDMM